MLRLAPVEEFLWVGEIDIEEVPFTGGRDGRKGTIVEKDTRVEGELALDKLTEVSGIHEVSEFAVKEVAEFGIVVHVIYHKDIGQTAAVQLLDKIRADETGAPSDDDHFGGRG